MKTSILDFDQTITIKHTFRQRCLDNMLEMSPEERINQGILDAQQNIKKNISAQLEPFKFNEDEMFCIASYHNNPDYIMGYCSVLLGKKITFKETIDDEAHGIAISVCTVEDSNQPLMISYIPKLGHDFQATMNSLHGKNEQIGHLRHVLEAEGFLAADNVCDFYDDSKANIDASGFLYNIKGYQVKLSDQFKVTAIKDAQIIPDAPVVANAGFKPQAAAHVTFDDLRATGLVNEMNQDEATKQVWSTGEAILRSGSDGGITITTKLGTKVHHIRVSLDMEKHPHNYQTLDTALSHLHALYGVNTQGAKMPQPVAQVEGEQPAPVKERFVTEKDISSWGIVQNMNAEQASEVAQKTGKSVLRSASIGGLAITFSDGRKGLIKADMQAHPNDYATKQKALDRLAFLGVDLSAVPARASVAGMFSGSASKQIDSPDAQPDSKLNNG